VERQWRRWAAIHGLDPVPILEVAHGRRTIDVIRLFAPHLATPEEAERFDDDEARDSEGAAAIPGAAALLRSLPDDRWAVVTSATTPLARERMRVVGLPLPRVIVSADDVERGKPAPDGFLAAAGRLGVEPQRCIAFEDTPAGLEAAAAAGAQVVGVTTTYAAEDLPAELCIPDLRSVRVAREASLTLRIVVT
jgi:sugar-phosphatase